MPLFFLKVDSSYEDYICLFIPFCVHRSPFCVVFCVFVTSFLNFLSNNRWLDMTRLMLLRTLWEGEERMATVFSFSLQCWEISSKQISIFELCLFCCLQVLLIWTSLKKFFFVVWSSKI